MKKFKFTLDRMLSFKNQILDKEKDLLGQIRHQKIQLEQTIERYHLKQTELSKEMTEAQRQGTTVLKLRGYSIQIENIHHGIKQLKKELVAIDAEVERQTDVVRKASQEVSSLEKLQERQWEQFLYEEKKRTEDEVLEFVTGRLVREGNFQ